MDVRKIKSCSKCGEEYRANHNAERYCKRCRALHKYVSTQKTNAIGRALYLSIPQKFKQRIRELAFEEAVKKVETEIDWDKELKLFEKELKGGKNGNKNK